MNNTPNYPYLSGYLQSALISLAWDHKFHKLKTVEAREKYLKATIEEARIEAVKYEQEVGTKL